MCSTLSLSMARASGIALGSKSTGIIRLPSASVPTAATIGMSGRRRFTPLHAAAFTGHAPVVALLLTHGADVHAKAGDGSGRRPPGVLDGAQAADPAQFRLGVCPRSGFYAHRTVSVPSGHGSTEGTPPQRLRPPTPSASSSVARPAGSEGMRALPGPYRFACLASAARNAADGRLHWRRVVAWSPRPGAA
jgi:hypothetical protein